MLIGLFHAGDTLSCVVKHLFCGLVLFVYLLRELREQGCYLNDLLLSGLDAVHLVVQSFFQKQVLPLQLLFILNLIVYVEIIIIVIVCGSPFVQYLWFSIEV